MKDPELMMYRVAIGQILADAGINRETIKDMVRQSIDEKVEKQIKNIVQAKIASLRYDNEVREALRDAVRYNVERAVRKLDVFLDLPLESCTDNELIAEAARRGMTFTAQKPHDAEC